MEKTIDFPKNLGYNITIVINKHSLSQLLNKSKGDWSMNKNKRKKSDNQDKTLKIIILITAILNLIKTTIDIIQSLLD